MILIFDSPDKCGKDSLISAVHKKTNYKYSMINRFSGTSFAYGKFWKRKLDYDSYLFQDLNLLNNGLLIYLEAPLKLLKKRFKENNEKDIDLKDLERLKTHYEEYLAKTPLKVVRVNTVDSIENCVIKIKNAIRNFEYEPINEKVSRLINFVEKNGDKIEKTLEVRNVNLTYSQKNLNNLNYALHTKEFIQELPEYLEIFHSLANKIRILVDYSKIQTLNSRQFVWSSNSCISSYHVIKRNNILEVTVYLRSSNLKKMLLLDICGISYIANKLNSIFECQEIKYNLNIGSAHIYR